MMVRVKAVNGRTGRVKTECSEDELPLDPDFAAVLLNWKTQCRQIAGDWVLPSHITDRCFHASPIQQDYIRPAGRKLGLEASGGTHSATPTGRGWTRPGRPLACNRSSCGHAQASTTGTYGGALLMSSKRDANSKVVRMALASQTHSRQTVA